MTLSNGQEGNSERTSTVGSVPDVLTPSKEISTATTVSKSTLTLAIMLILTERNGFNAKTVKNGFIQIVRLRMKMDLLSSEKSFRMKNLALGISALHAERRRR